MAEEKEKETGKPEEKPTGAPKAEAPKNEAKPEEKPVEKPVEAQPQTKPVETQKPVEAPKAHDDGQRMTADLQAEKLENAKLQALLTHPQIKRDDIDTLCGATTPEGIKTWADTFAARIKVSNPIAGQAALSQAAAHQGGVATPASDEYSPSNLYEQARKNARPHTK